MNPRRCQLQSVKKKSHFTVPLSLSLIALWVKPCIENKKGGPLLKRQTKFSSMFYCFLHLVMCIVSYRESVNVYTGFQ